MMLVADSPKTGAWARIDMLDALRGFALFGMLLVHAIYTSATMLSAATPIASRT